MPRGGVTLFVMSITSDLYELLSRLRSRRAGMARRDIERFLDCSPSTARRHIERLRTLGHDITWDGERYRLDDGARIELPGVAFRSEELAALLGLVHWMETAGAAVLKEKLDPLRARLERELEAKGLSAGQWRERVRLLPMHFRSVDPDVLVATADAVLRRRRLILEHRSADGQDFRTRRLSPQRLVHYRHNWYVDAWDHEDRALRCFGLSRVRRAEVAEVAAREVPRERLDAHFAGSYGIFGGRARGRAVLEFEGKAARIVREEVWHPAQKARDLPNGRFRLEFPCNDVRELTRDVMRFADEVTVVSPPALREAVAGMVRRANGRLDGTLRD